ncbi:MAG: pyridoxamine 5'-phosphate oxidase family protein [Clostridia bacterium]|nr:pyridoxamine 5'-phosphate oxidase family protein [Clostridia bacterium]
MENVEKVCQFLDDAGTYYLATVEGDKPRVRPFGTALVYGGKLYIQTGKVKAVSKQLAANPNAEICAFKDGKWIRIEGELINDDSRDVKVAMLDKMPTLKAMYSPDDDNTQVLYFKNATAAIFSFGGEPEMFAF